MKRNVHQNSLANLQHNGRPAAFGSKKKPRNLSLTEEGWAGISEMAKAAGCSSVSEFMERLGRGELKIA
jgi:hypothetical protein